MAFGSYDAIILGTILTVVGALLFVKAYLSPSFPDEAAQNFLDGNPFQIRNGIIQRYETMAGVIWLIIGSLGIIIGALWQVQHWQTGYLVDPYLDILVLFLVGVVAGAITVVITDRLSQRAYRPRMIEMQRNLFEDAATRVSHEGQTPDEVKGGRDVPPASRPSRLAEAAKYLDQIGKLLDVPRREDETDKQYVERLKPFFSS
jgi:uncharacterized membrane protein